jgi:putative ABC transport system ATP-binding protein
VGRDARISDEHRRPAIEVRDVTKTFHRGGEAVHAVRDATVVVGEGELVGLVGRSGSGKTTLLNLMSGWERADVGDVVLADGRAVDRSAPWAEVAVLPQRLGLIEEFTVRENVEYPARLAGVLGSTEELADELIHDLGLSALQHRYPRETSVGEQQRAALARALILTPVLLLADEPTGHQDGAHARDMLEAIRRAVARGTACVAATHSDELIRYLDRVVTMVDGRLVADADTMRA